MLPEGVEQPRQAFVQQVMGLPVSVHVRGPQARGDEVAAAVEAFFAALRDDDARFSTWRPDSPVSRIRRGDLTLADAEPRVREVAALCEEAARRTDGAFSAWLPGPDGVPTFDPTGLVKGWAVEQAFDELRNRVAEGEPHDLLVSAGGDVVVACARTDTPDWTIGIEDPQDRSRVLRTVGLRRGAVATSGTAARGQHVIDPASGAPPSGLLSATVIGPDLTWADVYATAAFVRGAQAQEWIATLPDHVAVLVGADGAVQ
ncbi:FAD:protein FMN transferase [Angustibacter luteus]|uniref:FAD:protein FMN transferase n=1 Tax=Angustibacter luteus TaxID=658456 RepID=A0ABW1JII7_9ACTN